MNSEATIPRDLWCTHLTPFLLCFPKYVPWGQLFSWSDVKKDSGRVSLGKGTSGQFAENQLLVASSPNTSSMIDLFVTYAKFTYDDLAAYIKKSSVWWMDSERYFSEYELILRCSPRCWENTNSGMLAKTKFSLFEKLLLEIVHFFYRMIQHFICDRIASAIFDFFLCFQNVIF